MRLFLDEETEVIGETDVDDSDLIDEHHHR